MKEQYELFIGTGKIAKSDDLEKLIITGIREWKSRIYANRSEQGPDIRIFDPHENKFMQIGSARLVNRADMMWENAES